MTRKICLVCELEKYPRERLKDRAFFEERLNEFYPQNDYPGYAYVCPECDAKLVEYYLNK